MAKINCVVNKKGGIGKTTTVCTLAELLSLYGKKVLVVDLNPAQANASLYFKRFEEEDTVINIFENGNMSEEEVRAIIYKTDNPNIDIIPGNPKAQEEEDMIEVNTTVNKDFILLKALEHICDNYDFIIIDTTPAFNFLTRSALCASEGVLVPVEDDMFNYTGVGGVINSINKVKSKFNPDLKILGVFFTGVKEVRSYKVLREMYNDEIGEYLLNTSIRFAQAFKDTITSGMLTIPEGAKNTSSLLDYRKLLLELDWLDRKASGWLKKDIHQGEERENFEREKAKERRKNKLFGNKK